MNGSAKRTERLQERWPLEVTIPALSCSAGKDLIRELFEPLGYAAQVTNLPLDERFPDWGRSNVFRVVLRADQTVQALLNHLYVLLPALDRRKHYYVGSDEVEKLLAKGKEWLADHPARDAIVRRYLKYQAELARKALSQLNPEQPSEDEESNAEEEHLEQTIDGQVPRQDAVLFTQEEGVEDPKPRLQEVRLSTVLGALRDPAVGVRSVLDIGCAGGHFLRLLAKDRRFHRITGMDVSIAALQQASRRLGLERGRNSDRVSLIHGSLLYCDSRLAGFDAITLIEVIEHLDPPRLRAAERVIFEYAAPRLLIVTTPNAEYNVVWSTLPAGTMRHRDHRFEWTRQEFADWCQGISERFGYRYTTHGIGPYAPENPAVGAPTQMAIFLKNEILGDAP